MKICCTKLKDLLDLKVYLTVIQRSHELLITVRIPANRKVLTSQSDLRGTEFTVLILCKNVF